MSYNTDLTEKYTTVIGKLLQAYKNYVKAPVYNSPQARALGKIIYETKRDPMSPAMLTTFKSLATYLSDIHPVSYETLHILVGQYLDYKGGEKS